MTMGCHGSTQVLKTVFSFRAWREWQHVLLPAEENGRVCKEAGLSVPVEETGKGRNRNCCRPLPSPCSQPLLLCRVRNQRGTLLVSLHELLPPRRGLHLHDLHFSLVFLLHHHLLLLAVCQGGPPLLLSCAPCRLHPMAGASTLWTPKTAEAEATEPNVGETATAKLVELGLRRRGGWRQKLVSSKIILIVFSLLSAPQSFNPLKPWLQGLV